HLTLYISRSYSVVHPFFSSCSADHRHLHSFPTRRSSDLGLRLSAYRGVRSALPVRDARIGRIRRVEIPPREGLEGRREGGAVGVDRKSTRLNSSHVKISYAVFCLKKKKKKKYYTREHD